ncbi:phage repressor protein [Aquimarina sp. BL5]|nr:phage repressor protein [Aquimarina sp. BL5]RKM91850.1 phage repressor protein [Aquimarina sp. BL5]
MIMNWKIQKLLNGETIVSKEPGNSMLPILQSKQPVVLEPVNWEDCKAGDIVFCKVKGNCFTHLVKGKNVKRGLLIGNNRGRINGWTKNVYGKVIEILPKS